MAAQEGPPRLPRQGHFFICNTISPAPPGLAFHPSYFGVGSRRTHPEKSNSFHMDFQTHLCQPLRAEPASAACPPPHLRVDPAGLPSPSCPGSLTSLCMGSVHTQAAYPAVLCSRQLSKTVFSCPEGICKAASQQWQIGPQPQPRTSPCCRCVCVCAPPTSYVTHLRGPSRGRGA